MMDDAISHDYSSIELIHTCSSIFSFQNLKGVFEHRRE